MIVVSLMCFSSYLFSFRFTTRREARMHTHTQTQMHALYDNCETEQSNANARKKTE